MYQDSIITLIYWSASLCSISWIPSVYKSSRVISVVNMEAFSSKNFSDFISKSIVDTPRICLPKKISAASFNKFLCVLKMSNPRMARSDLVDVIKGNILTFYFSQSIRISIPTQYLYWCSSHPSKYTSIRSYHGFLGYGTLS